MKAIISNRIYLEKDPKVFKEALDELTYKIPAVRFGEAPQIHCDITIMGDKVFSIPVGRTDLLPDGTQVIDKRTHSPVALPAPLVTLREDQEDVYNQAIDNCLINAKPGWGKTFVSLFIAKKLEQKTLVVVHNTALRDQWVTETEKVFGFTPGIIGTGKFETNTPIVISNTQTLVKHIHKYSKDFGTLIVDECHRVPASTFKTIVDASYARYKIGLSATIKRKDGRHVYIPDYFSSKLIVPEFDNAMEPIIYVYYTPFKFNPKTKGWAKKLTEVQENPEYQKLVADIVKIKTQQAGHNCLILSDRLAFLRGAYNITQQDDPGRTLLITSEVNNREELHKKVYTGEINSIYGTMSIYKEGISVNPLSCLILATPIKNQPLLEQVIGRVTRPHPGKKQPEIIDLVFEGKTGKIQLADRWNYYASKGYKIIEVDLR